MRSKYFNKNRHYKKRNLKSNKRYHRGGAFRRGSQSNNNWHNSRNNAYFALVEGLSENEIRQLEKQEALLESLRAQQNTDAERMRALQEQQQYASEVSAALARPYQPNLTPMNNVGGNVNNVTSYPTPPAGFGVFAEETGGGGGAAGVSKTLKRNLNHNNSQEHRIAKGSASRGARSHEESLQDILTMMISELGSKSPSRKTLRNYLELADLDVTQAIKYVITHASLKKTDESKYKQINRLLTQLTQLRIDLINSQGQFIRIGRLNKKSKKIRYNNKGQIAKTKEDIKMNIRDKKRRIKDLKLEIEILLTFN